MPRVSLPADPSIPAERRLRAEAERGLLGAIRTFEAGGTAAEVSGLVAKIRAFEAEHGGPSRAIHERMRDVVLARAGDAGLSAALDAHWLAGERDLSSDEIGALLARNTFDGKTLARFAALLEAGSGLTEDELHYLTAVLAENPGLGPEVAAIAERVRDRFRARLDALLDQPRFTARDVYNALTDAIQYARAESVLDPDRDLAGKVDARLDELLVFGDAYSKAPEVARTWFAGRRDATAPELEMIARTLADRHGALTLGDVRVLATRIDANGARGAEERRGLSRIRALPVADEARPLFDELLAGPIPAAELYPRAPAAGGPVGWLAENAASSGGATLPIELPTPTERPGRLEFPWFTVHTDVRAADLAVAPDPDGDGTTEAAFDVAAVARTLTSALSTFDRLGYPPSAWLRAPIDVHPAGRDDLNADYTPWKRALHFGTTRGAFHTASDADVVVHELGHLVLDHVSPGLLDAGEGAAVHEGLGDALAAVLHADPEIAEDAAGATRDPAGFRTAAHDRDLGFAGAEAHGRGTVYAALVWDVFSKLRETDAATARDHGLRFVFETAIELGGRGALSPASIYLAMEKAADALPEASRGAAKIALARSATKRGLLDRGLGEARKAELEARRAAERLQLQLPAPPTAAALMSALNEGIEPLGDRPSVRFFSGAEVPRPDGGRRVMFQVGDPSGALRAERWMFADLGADGKLHAISPEVERALGPAFALSPAVGLDKAQIQSMLDAYLGGLQGLGAEDAAFVRALRAQVSAGRFEHRLELFPARLAADAPEAGEYGERGYVAGFSAFVDSGPGVEGGALLAFALGDPNPRLAKVIEETELSATALPSLGARTPDREVVVRRPGFRLTGRGLAHLTGA